MADFLALVAPQRPVVCATLSAEGPPHLRRAVRLFHNSAEAEWGRKEWLSEIRHACAAWHEDNELRLAVCVGSKTQMRTVCRLLQKEHVPFKPYSANTHEGCRLDDLRQPDAVWCKVGAVVSTTTLSIGVNPQSVRFARVFVWTCRLGCNVLAQAQAAQRFGRGERAPLLNRVIDVLVDGVEPHVRDELVAGGRRAAATVTLVGDSHVP